MEEFLPVDGLVGGVAPVSCNGFNKAEQNPLEHVADHEGNRKHHHRVEESDHRSVVLKAKNAQNPIDDVHDERGNGVGEPVGCGDEAAEMMCGGTDHGGLGVYGDGEHEKSFRVCSITTNEPRDLFGAVKRVFDLV